MSKTEKNLQNLPIRVSRDPSYLLIYIYLSIYLYINLACLHQNSIVIKFFKILKIREIFCENPRIIFILFYDVHKDNMFRTNLEDGREAPSKASIDKFSQFRKMLCPFLLVRLKF